MLTKREKVPSVIYFFKVNNGNTRTMSEIFSKSTINTLERRHERRSGVFIFHFEQISHIIQVFPFLTLNKSVPVGLFSEI